MTLGNVTTHSPGPDPVTEAVEICWKIIKVLFTTYWGIQRQSSTIEEAYLRVNAPGQVVDDVKQKDSLHAAAA